MGLAASQARLLTLTSRMNDLECNVMRLSARKMTYSIESMNVAATYNQEMEVAEAIAGEKVITGYTPIQKSRTVDGPTIAVTGRTLRENHYQLIINPTGESNGGGNTPQSSGSSITPQHTYCSATYLTTNPTMLSSYGINVGDIALVTSDATHGGQDSYYQLEKTTTTSSGTIDNPEYNNIPQTVGELLNDLSFKGIDFYAKNGNSCGLADLIHEVNNQDIKNQTTGEVYASQGTTINFKDFASYLGNYGSDYSTLDSKVTINADKYRTFFNIPEKITTSISTDTYSWKYLQPETENPGNSGGNNGNGTTINPDDLDNMTGAKIQALIVEGKLTLKYNGQEIDEVPATLQGDSTIEYYTEDAPNYGTDYTKRDAAKRAAQTKYDRALANISKKEKMLDLEMNQDNTELSACNKEYESVKSLIEKNVEQGFKLFS